MAELSASNCVLIVADPDRIADLASGLAPAEVLVSSGGDDTIDLFEERRPPVVVVTATLEAGDSKALIEALRSMVRRSEVEIILVGDEAGPIRTVLDAHDMGPVRFVTSPVAPRALRAAVAMGIEAVSMVRGSAVASGEIKIIDPSTSGDKRVDQRARWDALADSFVSELDDEYPASDEAEALPPPIVIRPRRISDPPVDAEVAPVQAWRPGTTSEIRERDTSNRWSAPESPTREPTLIIRDPEPTDAAQSATSSSFTSPFGSSAGSTSGTASGSAPLRSPEHRAVAEAWSGALPLADLIASKTESTIDDDLGLDEFDEDMVLGDDPPREVRLAILDDLPDREPSPPLPPTASASLDGRDFARQLRAKMSMMAQRLFQGGDASTPQPAVDLGPRHDHHTEIDLAARCEGEAVGREV